MQIRLQGAETTKLLQRPTNPAGPQVRVKSILKNKQQLQLIILGMHRINNRDLLICRVVAQSEQLVNLIQTT